MGKGQAALEFIMLVGLALIFLMLVIIIGANLGAEHIEQERSQRLLAFGYYLQNELIVATTLQEGYEHDIEIPERIGAFNLAISNNERAFILNSGSQNYTFLTPPMVGTFVQGTNTIVYDGGLRIE